MTSFSARSMTGSLLPDNTQPLHRAVFLVYPQVSAFDIAGPAQALAEAGRYDIVTLSLDGGPIQTDAGLVLESRRSSSYSGAIGTLFLPGGSGFEQAQNKAELVAEVRRLSDRAARTACVCVGAFLAARAGILAGRRATTHWRACRALQACYPDIEVEPDAIWLRDGPVWTSAGVSAGVDLALALVEEDCGAERAIEVAKTLVVFVKRPGGQSQFSQLLRGQLADAGGEFGDLIAWIADHLQEDLRVENLARRASMSPRNFTRRFSASTGTTPAKAVEAIRVEAARAALESGADSVAQLARRFGFGQEERLRRAFIRHYGAGPTALAERFRSAGAE